MSTTAHQLGRIQALIEKMVLRLGESERQREALEAKVSKLEAELKTFSSKPMKNAKEIEQKIDTYLKDIDICLENLNGQSQAGTK
ncbi:MAG: hypothetical protein AB8F95_02985 [Bacteroidia bacterium]